jgi:hypothetical protein
MTARILPLVSTPDRFTEDMHASCRLRGLSWDGQVSTLADILSALGIREGDVIGSLEIGIAQHGTGRITAERDEFGCWEVREIV